MQNSLKIGLVQQACGADADANLACACAGIRDAAAAGADIVVLPELHRTPYFCQTEDPACFDLAETIPGPTCTVLAAAARTGGVVVVGSLFERRGAGLFHNTAVVFDTDGSLAGRYRKMHIPDDPGYYEKFYFTPGDLGFEPIVTSVAVVGVLVCWDQWFPEAARLMALAGAELLVYPTAIGWDRADDTAERERQLDAWTTVQRAHAVANGIPVAAVNRVGFEPSPADPGAGIEFWGNSFAVGPQGEWLTRCGTDVMVQVVEIDRARTESVRRMWPYMRDRRVDAYDDLLRLYRD